MKIIWDPAFRFYGFNAQFYPVVGHVMAVPISKFFLYGGGMTWTSSKLANLPNQMGNQIRAAILTLLRGWITSRRIQSTPRSCTVYAYSLEDEPQHYATCDTLCHAIQKSLLPFIVSFDPLVVLGLSAPCPFQRYGIYVGYNAYDSLRHQQEPIRQDVECMTI